MSKELDITQGKQELILEYQKECDSSNRRGWTFFFLMVSSIIWSFFMDFFMENPWYFVLFIAAFGFLQKIVHNITENKGIDRNQIEVSVQKKGGNSVLRQQIKGSEEFIENTFSNQNIREVYLKRRKISTVDEYSTYSFLRSYEIWII